MTDPLGPSSGSFRVVRGGSWAISAGRCRSAYRHYISPDGESVKPSVAVASDGTVYVAWSDSSGGNPEIYIKRWNASAWEEVGAGSASGRGISDSDGQSLAPSLAVATDGTPYVAWSDATSGTSQIYIRVWSGTTWEEVGAGSASGSGISASSTDSLAPSLAVSPDGVPYLAWHGKDGGTDDEIFVRRWSGSLWEAVGAGSATGTGISDNTGNSTAPSLAMDPDGYPYIAWSDSTSGFANIYVRTWNGSGWVAVGTGSSSGLGISQAATDCLGASLAVGPDGKPVVSWSQQSSGNLEIFVRGWNGSIWDEVGAGSATAGGISGSAGASSEPSLAVSAEGTFLAAWTDDTSGNDEIYAQLFEVTYIPAVIPDTTKPLSGQALQSLESVSSDGVTFTFREPPGRWRTSSPSAVNPTDLEPGDIIVGGPSPATPYGFLRKVTGVSHQGDNIVVETTGATLDEAVLEGSLQASTELGPDDIEPGQEVPGFKILRVQGVDGTFKLVFDIDDVVLYDGDGNKQTKDDQVTADGSIEVQWTYDVDLQIRRNLGTSRFLFFNSATTTVGVDILCGVAATLAEKEWNLRPPIRFKPYCFTIPAPPPIFAIPVWITPVITPKVGIDGTVHLGVQFGATNSMSFGAGIQYSNGAWSQIKQPPTTEYSVRRPGPTAEMEAKGYGDIEFAGLFYGVVGPHADLDPYLRLEATMLPALWWGLYGGLEIPIGVKMEVLGKKIFNYEPGRLVLFEKLIAESAPNSAPEAPSSPSPVDGATGQSVTVNLGWAGDDPDGDAVTFDVYFEAGDTTPDAKVANHQAAKTYDLPVLAAGTHYYWQIIAFDEHGLSTAGPVWDFTTAAGTNNPPNPPSAPSPVDGATGQSVTVNLGWAGDDPDGDAVTFDVYFEAGDTTPDVKVADHQAAKTYDLPVLAVGTHYYWQIIAFDEHGLSTAGPVWDFTTASGGTGLVEMVDVLGGTFTMGRRDDGDDGTYGYSDELPRHEVTLSAYRIGKYEVTNGQFCQVLDWALGHGYLKNSGGGPYTGGDVYASGQKVLAVTSSYCQISYTAGSFVSETRDANPMDNHPVVMVTWYGAVAFANWLSEKEGLTPAYNLSTWQLEDADSGTPGTQFTNGYRLPTEAEWERAAAWDGSKHWIYGFESDTLSGQDRANYGDYNPLALSSNPYTSPVGWFDGVNVSPNGPVQTVNSPSPVGAYDMSGNVWEWCHDWYNSSYYSGGAMTDPLGPTSGSYRVVRGGGWDLIAWYCRSAYRYDFSPGISYSDFGFRLAAVPAGG